ncbi:MAG: hypothetical protein P1U32_02120 [Legionellaceae bacterium]|nr:hypothetical protein [Legionellaceae bacterium]
MSATSHLFKFYRGIFAAGVDATFTPYEKTYEAAEKAEVGGCEACIMLTIIPVLPTLTALAMALSLAALLISALSSIVAVPTTLAIDVAFGL